MRAPVLYPSRWCLRGLMGQLRVWRYSLPGQIIDGLADASHHIFKRVIMSGPSGDGLAICRQHLEFGKRRSLPIGRPQDDRQDTRLVGVMPRDSPRHLDAITEVRVHKVSADQQQNNLIPVQMLPDL